MVKLKIQADTAEELRNQLITLIGQQPAIVSVWKTEEQPESTLTVTEKTLEKPKTRSRAAVQSKEPDADIPSTTVPDPTLITPDPEVPAPAQTIAPADDLLGTSSTPASNLLDTPVVAKPATGETPTLEQLKHKIASNTNKQAIRDLIKSGYTKADGSPCYGPSDVQEKDYAAFWAKLDTL